MPCYKKLFRNDKIFGNGWAIRDDGCKFRGEKFQKSKSTGFNFMQNLELHFEESSVCSHSIKINVSWDQIIPWTYSAFGKGFNQPAD